jgi:hypothetical protein
MILKSSIRRISVPWYHVSWSTSYIKSTRASSWYFSRGFTRELIRIYL